MPTVTFRPGGAVVELPAGQTVFDAGLRIAAGIETACVGKGTCGLCRVRVLEGADHLSPLSDEDRKHLGNVYHLTKVRLACRAQVHGDVVVEPVARRVRR
ncbi:MAG: 2Fe-2S iron-sulfur cluster-binding protein [Kofleriaceae bacterium]